MPEYFVSDKRFFDKDEWMNSDFMKGGKIANKYKMVCDGIDGILAENGYIRNEKGIYDVKNPVPNHNWSDPIVKLTSLGPLNASVSMDTKVVRRSPRWMLSTWQTGPKPWVG